MSNPFPKFLKWVYEKFGNDASKMLITTSVIGWLLSMTAQVVSIATNSKIKEDQKVFLIPQEFNDALINIASFLLITTVTKKTVSNMFTTGKFAPKSVREFLKKHSNLYGQKVGKIGFDLKSVLQNDKPELVKTYEIYKNFGTTLATVCAGIFATNIVTPIMRNKVAASVQKSYIKEFKKPETNDAVKNPTESTVQKTNVVNVPKPQLGNLTSRSSMQI